MIMIHLLIGLFCLSHLQLLLSLASSAAASASDPLVQQSELRMEVSPHQSCEYMSVIYLASPLTCVRGSSRR
jgi:hypothetical protein